MKIAYLILTHTDPSQLERLVNAINYNCNIFIHLDKKTDLIEYTKDIALPENAIFISDRVNVNWGGFSMVHATLNLIKSALETEEEFSHLVFLSGLDYPIQPIKRIHNSFVKNPHKQFIRFINIEDSPEYYLKVASHFYFRDSWFPYDTILRKIITKLSTSQTIIKKKPLKNIKRAFGFANWAITSQCAAYILKFVEENQQFVKYYKTHDCPDEFFFHTIIANSLFFSETEGFYEYKGRGTPKYSYFHIFRSGKHDKVYELSDFNELKNSNKFFARKITSKDSLELIKRIDEELLKKNESSIIPSDD